jgi:hypothetical protein
MKITTYLDGGSDHVDLECAPRPRLVFRGWCDKGPGMMSESFRYHYGPSICGTVHALWLSSDWNHEALKKSAIAWTKSEKLPDAPWVALLRALWEAEKKINFFDGPNYSEIEGTPRSLMNPREIEDLADSVWPDRRD